MKCRDSQACGLPAGSVVKNPACNAGDMEDVSSIPGLGRSPGERNGNQLQYSCLGNGVDRGACGLVYGVAKESDTTEQLNNNKSQGKPNL